MNMEHRRILDLADVCTGCFACANACAHNAIDMCENEEGFYFPSVDASRCVDCGQCDKACPCLVEQPFSRTLRSYYGWSKDDGLRKASSSGGMFSLLSEDVLRNGGVVYGAAFSKSPVLRLECLSTRNVPLDSLRKSKYVQSYVGMAYRQVRDDLRQGRRVLFCGTPCQTAGLCSFLRGKPEGLLLVDFVCHGVPSMDMLRKHLAYLHIDDVVDICFRPKNRGWVDDFRITYDGGKRTYVRPWQYDEYYRMFMEYRNLRRSCRNCMYCNGNRMSDVTLADFWGVAKYDPSLYDVRGLSVVCANTERGIDAMESLGGRAGCVVCELDTRYTDYLYERVRTDSASKYNYPQRNDFFRDVYSLGYPAALKKYGHKVSMLSYLKYRLKELLRSCLSLRK